MAVPYIDLFNLAYSTSISESVKNEIIDSIGLPIFESEIEVPEDIYESIYFLDELAYSDMSEELISSIIDDVFEGFSEEYLEEVYEAYVRAKALMYISEGAAPIGLTGLRKEFNDVANEKPKKSLFKRIVGGAADKIKGAVDKVSKWANKPAQLSARAKEAQQIRNDALRDREVSAIQGWMNKSAEKNKPQMTDEQVKKATDKAIRRNQEKNNIRASKIASKFNEYKKNKAAQAGVSDDQASKATLKAIGRNKRKEALQGLKDKVSTNNEMGQQLDKAFSTSKGANGKSAFDSNDFGHLKYRSQKPASPYNNSTRYKLPPKSEVKALQNTPKAETSRSSRLGKVKDQVHDLFKNGLSSDDVKALQNTPKAETTNDIVRKDKTGTTDVVNAASGNTGGTEEGNNQKQTVSVSALTNANNDKKEEVQKPATSRRGRKPKNNPDQLSLLNPQGEDEKKNQITPKEGSNGTGDSNPPTPGKTPKGKQKLKNIKNQATDAAKAALGNVDSENGNKPNAANSNKPEGSNGQSPAPAGSTGNNDAPPEPVNNNSDKKNKQNNNGTGDNKPPTPGKTSRGQQKLKNIKNQATDTVQAAVNNNNGSKNGNKPNVGNSNEPEGSSGEPLTPTSDTGNTKTGNDSVKKSTRGRRSTPNNGKPVKQVKTPAEPNKGDSDELVGNGGTGNDKPSTPENSGKPVKEVSTETSTETPNKPQGSGDDTNSNNLVATVEPSAEISDKPKGSSGTGDNKPSAPGNTPKGQNKATSTVSGVVGNGGKSGTDTNTSDKDAEGTSNKGTGTSTSTSYAKYTPDEMNTAISKMNSKQKAAVATLLKKSKAAKESGDTEAFKSSWDELNGMFSKAAEGGIKKSDSEGNTPDKPENDNSGDKSEINNKSQESSSQPKGYEIPDYLSDKDKKDLEFNYRRKKELEKELADYEKYPDNKPDRLYVDDTKKRYKMVQDNIKTLLSRTPEYYEEKKARKANDYTKMSLKKIRKVFDSFSSEDKKAIVALYSKLKELKQEYSSAKTKSAKEKIRNEHGNTWEEMQRLSFEAAKKNNNKGESTKEGNKE